MKMANNTLVIMGGLLNIKFYISALYSGQFCVYNKSAYSYGMPGE